MIRKFEHLRGTSEAPKRQVDESLRGQRVVTARRGEKGREERQRRHVTVPEAREAPHLPDLGSSGVFHGLKDQAAEGAAGKVLREKEVSVWATKRVWRFSGVCVTEEHIHIYHR